LRWQELLNELKLLSTSLRERGKETAATNVDPDTNQNNYNALLSSLFIGGDKEPSLSLFQIFFWT
jgi:hypothetical protein